MMRKLAIASLLVAGVALSGSVFAQAASSAPAGHSQHQHHQAQDAQEGCQEDGSGIRLHRRLIARR
jgi:hypothetical protein